MHMEATTPEGPTVEPTEMSIPADVMTSVMPSAIMP
mgnify:CR=1 FL=1